MSIEEMDEMRKQTELLIQLVDYAKSSHKEMRKLAVRVEEKLSKL